MRKLIVSTMVTLDGVCGDPQSWAGEFFDEQAVEESLAVLRDSDGMLMGRNTYEYFAPAWSSGQGPYLQRINEMPKYVFSSTMTQAAWSNTTIVVGDPVAAVRELKEQGDRSLAVYGYGRLSQTLLEHGLVDELNVGGPPGCAGQRGHAFPPRQAGEGTSGVRHQAPQRRRSPDLRERVRNAPAIRRSHHRR
jgi:dihydrofolate reductase